MRTEEAEQIYNMNYRGAVGGAVCREPVQPLDVSEAIRFTMYGLATLIHLRASTANPLSFKPPIIR